MQRINWTATNSFGAVSGVVTAYCELKGWKKDVIARVKETLREHTYAGSWKITLTDEKGACRGSWIVKL